MMQKVFIVTGANRGIGKAVAAQLAQQNKSNQVVLAVRDELSGQECLNELKGKGFSNLHLECCNVGNEDSIIDFAKRIRQKFQQVDVIINNAGAGWNLTGDALTSDLAKEIMDINYNGPKWMTKHLESLFTRPGGRIIHVSSEAGILKRSRYSDRVYTGLLEADSIDKVDQLAWDFLQSVQKYHETKSPPSDWPVDAYRSSKALLNALTRIQAQQYASDGIFVASMCPGWVNTRMGGPSAPRTPDQGADTIVWLATSNEPTNLSGSFWQDRKVLKPAL